MNSTSLLPFKGTIDALESFIRELEVNVGVEHKPSPFDAYFPKTQQAPAVQPTKVQEQEVKEEAKEQPKEKQDQRKQGDQANKKEKQPQPEQQKKVPKQKAPAEKAAEPSEFADLASLDIRVGQLLDVWIHPESDKLYCEKIDIGFEIREIASGLQHYVPLDQMKGQVLVLSNLKGKKLAGFMSNGMVLCASNADHSKVEILRPPEGSKVGERVRILGQESLFKDEPEPVLNPKKKQWENVQPKLLTNENLEATFNGNLFVTSAGTIKCQSLSSSSIS